MGEKFSQQWARQYGDPEARESLVSVIGSEEASGLSEHRERRDTEVRGAAGSGKAVELELG